MIGRLHRRLAAFFAGGEPMEWPTTAPDVSSEDPLRLGEQAQRLMDDPVLSAAFAAAENALHKTWAASSPDDVTGRERVFATLDALHRVRSELRRMAGNSKIIAAEMARAEAAKQK